MKIAGKNKEWHRMLFHISQSKGKISREYTHITINFPKISILTRGWWILYHCKKYPHTTEVYPTYNVPKQQKEVFSNIVLTPIEVLEAE